MITQGLTRVSRLISNKKNYIKLIEKLFDKIMDSKTIENICKNIIEDMRADNYLAFEKLGRPCQLDYDLTLNKYNEFVKDYRMWFIENKDIFKTDYDYLKVQDSILQIFRKVIKMGGEI